jgi:hypothetical protein
MTNKMAHETNAILAINSLDRFITDRVGVWSTFFAIWQNNANQLTYLPVVGPNLELPEVGAKIQGAGAVGIPEDSEIIAFDPVTNIVTIDQDTTMAQAALTRIGQYIVNTVNYYNDTLEGLYYNVGEKPCNNFTLQSQGSYIYGYFTKLIVSQIQLQWNIPTVNEDLNDRFYIADYAEAHLPQEVIIPHGFYYPDELAAILQEIIRGSTTFNDMEVVFIPRDGFVFTSATAFYFPDTIELQRRLFLTQLERSIVLKTYRLLGLTSANSLMPANPALIQQSYDYPNFLYTPYIDFYSDTLSNYQNVKDTNTSLQSPKGLITRLYVSGTGQNQTTVSLSALGSAPFVMTSDLNSPKVIRWTPDVTVTSIDFQLRDCYGELIPGDAFGYTTEFQMTLLCVEGD